MFLVCFQFQILSKYLTVELQNFLSIIEFDLLK